MDTILNYLNDMFHSYPSSAEMQNVKQKIRNAMEQKYNELIANGAKENEAIGTVISEYGDLKDATEKLNIPNISTYINLSDTNVSHNFQKLITQKFAADYIKNLQIAAHLTAIGVTLCFLAPIFLIIYSFSGDFTAPFIFKNNIIHLSQSITTVHIGFFLLLCMISVAILFFIGSSIIKKRYRYLHNISFTLDELATSYIHNMALNSLESSTIKTIIGIILCMIGVLPIVLNLLLVNNEIFMIVGSIIFLFSLAIASYLFITSKTTPECAKFLLSTEKYTTANIQAKHLVRQFGSIFWILVILFYFIITISEHLWMKSWIILMIAAILFSIIRNIIYYTVNNQNQK